MSHGQVWTGQSLAQRSGLSLRTVRRAVAAQCKACVAIDTDVGRGGGIRLGTRSALPSVRLSHREAIGMLFAFAVAESRGLPLLGGGLARMRTLLDQARGVALTALGLADLSVAEYTALQIKVAKVGHGPPAKARIQAMMQRLLALPGLPGPDAADALGPAITHAHAGPQALGGAGRCRSRRRR